MAKYRVVDFPSQKADLVEGLVNIETDSGEWELVTMTGVVQYSQSPSSAIHRTLLAFRSTDRTEATEELKDGPDWEIEAADKILREVATTASPEAHTANEKQMVAVREAASQAVLALGASIKAIGTPAQNEAAGQYLLSVRGYARAVLDYG